MYTAKHYSYEVIPTNETEGFSIPIQTPGKSSLKDPVSSSTNSVSSGKNYTNWRVIIVSVPLLILKVLAGIELGVLS